MKLKIGVYPGADHHKWLAFLHPEQKGIALELARRQAAFARDHGHKMVNTSAYRDVAYQQKLYLQNCKEHPPAGNGYVSKPGNSWHNGRCAVDVMDDGFWKKYFESGDMNKTAKQQELFKYGLYLPLNYKDAHTVFEWWHMQPTETLGYTGDRTRFLDQDDFVVGQLMPTLKIGSKGEQVKTLQLLMKDQLFDCGNPDGVFGRGTERTVMAFQHAKGLDDDGVVGPATWDKLL